MLNNNCDNTNMIRICSYVVVLLILVVLSEIQCKIKPNTAIFLPPFP